MKKTSLFITVFALILIVFSACKKPEEETNVAPAKPSQPSPSIGDIDVTINLSQIYWYCEDADGDPLSYDVYFGTNEEPEFLSTESQTIYDFSEALLPNTKYYWKIVAKDDHEHETIGDVWNFTTKDGGSGTGDLTWDKETIDNSGTGNFGLGYNCQIVVDASNGIHTVYTDRDNFKLKYAYKSSGGAWSISEIASDASGELASIAIDNNDDLHIVYEVYPGNYLKYATKTLNATTWTVADFPDAGTYYLASTETYFNLKTDANNGLHLVAANSGGDNFLQYFYKSATGDWTREALDNTQNSGEQPDVFIKDNTIHVCYGGNNGTLKYATKPIESGTWAIETIFSSTGIYHTAISLTSANEISIIFKDYAEGFKCASKTTGSWDIATIDDNYANYAGLDVSTDDILYASFSYYGGTGFKLGYKPADGSWTTQMIDEIEGYDYIQYTDIVCASNGHIYAVYQVAEGGSGRNILKFADIYWAEE